MARWKICAYMWSMRALCAEFPNDNPDLHLGAIWMQDTPTGPPAAEVRDIELADAVWLSEQTAPPAEAIAADTDPEPAVAERPPPIESMIVLTPADDEEMTPIVVEELDFEIEATDPPMDAVSNAGEKELVGAGPSETDDAYTSLVATLQAVAESEGGTPEAVNAILAGSEEAAAAAWRAELRGEVDDISTCGSAMLDEWAAEVVARAIQAPGRAGQLRRELRARGVCAFGLIAA